MSYRILLDLPAIPHGNEREKRAMIVICIPIVIRKAIAVEQAVTTREIMKTKAEVEMTSVNDIRVIVDIVMPMKTKIVGTGDLIHRYPLETVRIERIMYVKSDRSV